LGSVTLKLAGGPRGALARPKATKKLKPTVNTAKLPTLYGLSPMGRHPIYRESLMKDRSTKMDVK